ncbi:AtpZ/AtpI family protein [Hydrogenimonas sp.]
MQERKEEAKPTTKKVVEGAYDLSLGISIVVAVLIGVGLGYGMRSLFGYEWLFWLGVFWGVGGAILNIYKAYRKQVKAFEEYAEDPRYKNYSQSKPGEDE